MCTIVKQRVEGAECASVRAIIMGNAQTTVVADTPVQDGCLATDVCTRDVSVMRPTSDVWSCHTTRPMTSHVAISSGDVLVHCVRASRENVKRARTFIQQQQRGQLSAELLRAWADTVLRITVAVPADTTVQDVMSRVSQVTREAEDEDASQSQEYTGSSMQMFAFSATLETEEQFTASSMHKNFVTLTPDLHLGQLLRMQTVGLKFLPTGIDDVADERVTSSHERQTSQDVSHSTASVPSIVLFYEEETRFGMGFLEADCLMMLISMCTCCCMMCASDALANRRQQKYEQQQQMNMAYQQNQQTCANTQYYNGQQPMYYANNMSNNGVPNNYGMPTNAGPAQMQSGPVMGVPTKMQQAGNEPFNAL